MVQWSVAWPSTSDAHPTRKNEVSGMTGPIHRTYDVTEAANLGEPAHVAVSIHFPIDIPAEPIVCIAKHGGGYTKEYYTSDLPGPGRGSQAAWHSERGWIFVSVDVLGVGGSRTTTTTRHPRATRISSPPRQRSTTKSARNLPVDYSSIRCMPISRSTISV
jgi:hypothetical protein